MSDSESKRREISALIDDIARIQRELGPELMREFRQPDDREAFDIVARIERQLLANENAKAKGTP